MYDTMFATVKYSTMMMVTTVTAQKKDENTVKSRREQRHVVPHKVVSEFFAATLRRTDTP